ncbi:MAG TPA: TonB-dependent siderophore receptor [Vicinamibacterales bacterium]|nr:TonB-dependent siderophore receptor [Vicinamibacterales bacterium]
MTLRLNLISVVALVLLVPAAASAQTAVLRGRVVDPMRAAVAAARVIAVAAPGGSVMTSVSDAEGRFELHLEPGAYLLTISSPGFSEESRHITVPPSGAAPVEFVLQIAGFTQSVEVNGEAAGNTPTVSTSTKTPTPLRDVPQAVTVVPRALIRDQLMSSVADTVNYIPGITTHQGENNRDQIVVRGNSSSADFYVNGVRDDVQYYRDLYNVERIEALKGPNGMVFGRGGGGGVINRVTKQAGFLRSGETMLQAGSYGNRRFSADVNQPLTSSLALRVNGVFEDSDSFRRSVGLQRYGIAPSVTFVATPRTMLTIDYEHFHDQRVADRGISSFGGRPVDVPRSTFFGNPADSQVRADVDLAAASIEHEARGFTIRNRTVVGSYDRGYQNYVPGAVTDDRSRVALTAYNNATARLNTFNQTDVTRAIRTGRVRHMLLFGGEIGRQRNQNVRNTGYFENASTTVMVPLSEPSTALPVTYRQSATDANNRVRTYVGAVYLQDQAELSRFVQVIGGVRFDRFDLQFHNNRTGEALRRIDHLASPRAGVVLKPIASASIYSSFTRSYLPSSGDQFASLTVITQQMKPEQFTNYEVGAKWDATSELSLTTALYRLDRTNTRATDPNDPTRIVQTGSQRTDGYEFGINGTITHAWKMTGGYAHQHAFVTSATTAARAGAQVAQVPRHTFSLWNNYQLLPRVGAGLGIIRRTDMFAAIDDAVVLPAYTRADAAAFFSLSERTRLQVNVENLFDRSYFANADSNTNISPGSPRAVRVALSAGF